MHSSDRFSLLSDLFVPGNTVALWSGLALLFFALAIWAQRRSAAARARADRARREAALVDLGGDSYFMPLPTIEQAVEISSSVEIDSLLSGEPDTVAARARAQLTARTDISTTPGAGELPYVLGSGPSTIARAQARAASAVPRAAVPAAPAGAAAIAPRSTATAAPAPATIAIPMPRAAPPAAAPRSGAAMASAAAQVDAVQKIRAASAAASAPAAAAPARPAAPAGHAAAQSAAHPAAHPVAQAAAASVPGSATPPVKRPDPLQERVPVRDLVLTWFEARGYRASAVSVQFRPIELELRHRSDGDRIYAFVAERERLGVERAATLLKVAKAAGHARLLVAAEAGSDVEGLRALQASGLRVFDEAAIRAELGKIEVRVAAKILGAARSRTRARQAGTPLPAAKEKTAPGNPALRRVEASAEA